MGIRLIMGCLTSCYLSDMQILLQFCMNTDSVQFITQCVHSSYNKINSDLSFCSLNLINHHNLK